MKNTGDPRRRLLEAGEEVFARQGYRYGTIRDICQRAQVNVAMINYYFGGKEQLYRAVLEFSLGESIHRYMTATEAMKTLPPEEQLRGWIRGLLLHILEEGGASWNGRLMSREMVAPTFALDIVVDKVIRPRAQHAQALVRALLGSGAGEDLVFWCEQSIVSQCLHYRHNRPILDRLHPWLPIGAGHLDALAEHIAGFSLDALRAFHHQTRGHDLERDWGAAVDLEDVMTRGAPVTRKPPSDAAPRDRLLKAGAELFALVGYRRATIREISQRAHLNVAMINYYFGGKEQLYQAVLEHALHQSVERYVAAARPSHDAPPEQRLHAFVLALLLHVFDEEGAAPIGQLMSQEMAEPTFALDSAVEKVIRPRSEELLAIVRAFLGPEAGKESVVLCEQSIVAQCLNYRHIRPVLDRLYPSLKYGPAEAKRLARHITRFSLGALLARRRADP